MTRRMPLVLLATADVPAAGVKATMRSEAVLTEEAPTISAEIQHDGLTVGPG